MTRRALLIGIDDYPSAPLKACVNDAEELSKLLESNQSGSANFGIKLCLNLARKDQVMKEIRGLFEGRHDIALLYFSGHGLITGGEGYIVAPDYRKYDEGIPVRSILELSAQSKSLCKIIILDCCFSGTIGQLNGRSEDSLLPPDTVVLTACRTDEVAVEKNGHGIYTNLLLQALKGGAADLFGRISPASVYSFIDKSLGGWDQRPVFKANIDRLVTLRTVNPPIVEDALRAITQLFPEPYFQFKLDKTFEFTEPTAISENVAKFKILQKLERVGLVIPVEEEHLYWAAINEKYCCLTELGAHYWSMIFNKRF